MGRELGRLSLSFGHASDSRGSAPLLKGRRAPSTLWQVTPKTPKKLVSRKLLIATLGVATVNYIAVACTPPTSGNLPAPDPGKPDASTPTSATSAPPPTAGNLPAPQPIEPTPTPRADAGKR